MSSRTPLPIDAQLPEIAQKLRSHSAIVLQAPPGAGKTTRVPQALYDAFPEGEIVVLEPRRLAAHLCATRVAEERGERLGDSVGVQMRFASIVGKNTRLRFVTEGVLVRQLQDDATLKDVRIVILDEFHERHLASDLALALLARLQRGPRPDLKLCVMSATLDSAAVAAFLDNCPVIESPGRSFPVEIEYETSLADEPLWKQVRGALRKLLRKGSGDILVFLPGSAEIRRCQEELAELAAEVGFSVLPLHGDLPFEDQQRAVVPRSAEAPRKVILSTNVAETSLTIDGVTAVIDSGLARVAGHQSFSGLPTLRVQPISRAQAAQRAGRAGRTQPGRCIRLYSKLDHDARPEFLAPELRRLDLCELVLSLASSGVDAQKLAFLDPPPPAALEAAHKLLFRLGALDEKRALTRLGKKLAALPIHPRLGRIALAAEEAGLAQEGSVLAALLAERDLRAGRSGLGAGSRAAAAAEVHGPSDVLHLFELYEEARAARFARAAVLRMGLDPDVTLAVSRASQKLLSAVVRDGKSAPKKLTPQAQEAALLRAILFGYPDRVARFRKQGSGSGSKDFVLAGGGGAVLSPASVVQDADLVVLVDVETSQTKTLVRLASAIAADWLLELPGDFVRETSEPLWNASAERVEVVRRLLYEQLVLDESRVPGDGSDDAQVNLLFQKVEAKELGVFRDGEALADFVSRLALIAEHVPELEIAPPSSEAIKKAARGLLANRHSLEELGALSLIDALCADIEKQSALRGRSLRAEMARLTPEFVTLGRGRRVRVHYEPHKPPWVASRLQDFFTMAESPKVLAGRVAVVLHLLAPNQRAVQVTTDLAGFWSRHYPAIRKELCRRYPRHAWPEDPLA